MDITGVKRDVSYTLGHKDTKNNWPSGLVALSVIILVLAIVVAVGLKIWNGMQTKNLVTLKQEAEQLKGSFSGSEEDIIKTEKTLNNITSILKDHSNTSKLMTIIEENTDPKVYFSSLTWDPNTLVMALSGTTDSYPIISQQVLNFQQALLSNNGQLAFDKVTLKGAKTASTGKYDFNLELSVNKTALNF
jgi:hypothetical protein